MKKLTVREFRSNLKKCLDLLGKGELIEVGGIMLRDDKYAKKVKEGLEVVLKRTPEQEEFVERMLNADNPCVHIGKAERVHEEIEKTCECDMCKRNCTEFYRTYENGEEFRTCPSCIKKSVPTKMLKSTLRKLEKL
jgi:hypothetical protein